MAEIAKQRDLMLAERRRRDRGHAIFVGSLLAMATLTHGAAIYTGMLFARPAPAPVLTCPPPITPKPANQVLGCREVLKLCRAELQHPKGTQ